MSVKSLLAPPFTYDPVRHEMYRHDVYFREMAALVEQRPRQDVERMLCGSSFVMFKPDAVVGRRIEPALDFLAASVRPGSPPSRSTRAPTGSSGATSSTPPR
jgi:hypothetical protein